MLPSLRKVFYSIITETGDWFFYIVLFISQSKTNISIYFTTLKFYITVSLIFLKELKLIKRVKISCNYCIIIQGINYLILQENL